MARSDILLSLVQSAGRGDMVSFRKAVESMIAEERAKKHNILADRLATSLNNGSKNGLSLHAKGEAKDLLFEVAAEKTFEDLILDDAILASFCCGSPKISSLNTALAMSSKISSVGKGLVADLVGHGFYFTLSKRTFCVIHLKSK